MIIFEQSEIDALNNERNTHLSMNQEILDTQEERLSKVTSRHRKHEVMFTLHPVLRGGVFFLSQTWRKLRNMHQLSYIREF